MEAVLIVCRNLNIQKFYVFNLVIRGYPAVGIFQVAEQEQTFWQANKPGVVVMWGELAQLEGDVSALREIYDTPVPIVLVCRDKPTTEWISKYEIAAHTPYLSDSGHLVNFLQPWLSRSNSQPSSTQAGQLNQQGAG